MAKLSKAPKSSGDSRSSPPDGSVRKGAKKPSVSKSTKAGLVFPVARINRRLTENKTTKRVGGGAAIYMTAVLEYFTAEVLELAINEAKADSNGKRSRINPIDVLRAVRNDPAINKALNGLRVMVGDKQKDTAEQIISKTDLEAKQLVKMQSSDAFEIDGDVDVTANWKRYKKEQEVARA